MDITYLYFYFAFTVKTFSFSDDGITACLNVALINIYLWFGKFIELESNGVFNYVLITWVFYKNLVVLKMYKIYHIALKVICQLHASYEVWKNETTESLFIKNPAFIEVNIWH